FCQWQERSYAPGDSWSTDPCTTCTCKMGLSECVTLESIECQDPCSNSPCFNGATCIGSPGYLNYHCKCPPDWMGSKCHLPSHPCPTYTRNATCAVNQQRTLYIYD
ncbi:unnamed protein product, partial [Meganyctiphanes norvegica]